MTANFFNIKNLDWRRVAAIVGVAVVTLTVVASLIPDHAYKYISVGLTGIYTAISAAFRASKWVTDRSQEMPKNPAEI